MDTNTLILIFLVIFMLHNLEEIIMVERWAKRNYPRVKDRIPSYFQKTIDDLKDITAVQFAIVVFIVSVFGSILILVAVIGDYMFLFFGLAIIFVLNIFTHPLQSLFLKTYTPGVITSILLVIPYYVIFFNYFYTKNLINMKMVLGALVIFVLFIPAFILSQTLGRKLGKKL